MIFFRSIKTTILISLITLQVLFAPFQVLHAAASPWTQTDWSSGVGLDTSNQYSAISNIDATTSAGNLTLSSNWTNSGYKYRRSLTVDAAQVAGSSNLTDFTVLVSGTYSYLATTGNGGKVTNSNGYDIIFTSDSNGTTQLSHEIESYNPTTGQITMWVKIPTLDFDDNTTIYIFYGNSGVSTSQENISGSWSSNNVGVYHLDQDPSTTSPQIQDSTSNNFDGQSTGSMTSGDLVTGKVGSGIDFDGSNDGIINIGSEYNIYTDFEVPGGFTNTGLTYDSTEDVLWSGNFTNGSIVKMEKDGTLITSIATSAAGIQGVAYDSSNDSLWYADYGTDTIRNINKSGVEIGTISGISVSGGVNGLAYEAPTDSLWVSGVSGSIIKRYNASTGAELQSLTVAAGSAFDGIVYDASDDTLWITRDPRSVYNVNKTTGATIKSFTTEVYNIEHIALDTTDNTLYINHDNEYHSAVVDGNRVFQYSKPTGTSINNVDQFTVSAWIYPTNVSKGDQIIAEYYGTSGVLYNIFFRSTGAISTFVGTALNSTTGQVVNNNWYYLTATYNGTTAKIYKNGVELTSGARTRSAVYGGAMSIGIRGDGLTLPFQGKIDEVRASNTVLSSDAIATQYNNQNSPSTFYTLGSESERYTSSGTVTSNIFDSNDAGSNWGTLTYATDGTATTAVKVRTSNSSDMTGATDFASCTAIASEVDMSSNGCVTDGHRYIQYQVSLTSVSLETPTFQSITINFEATDSDVAVVANGAPTGSLVSGTTGTTISVTTDENATCKYSTVSGTAFDSMTSTFSTTGSTDHEESVTGLTDGQSYSFYVRCEDDFGNKNLTDYTISFAVSSSPVLDTPATSTIISSGSSAVQPKAPKEGFGVIVTQQQDNTLNLSFKFGKDTTHILISETNEKDSWTKIQAVSSTTWKQPKTNMLYVRFCSKFYQCSSTITKQITPISSNFKFSNNLSLNMIHPDVRELQKYLNTHGFVIASSGPGSPGKETNYFGSLTKKTLIRFQESHATEVLKPTGLSKGTGYFGPSTRNFINEY